MNPGSLLLVDDDKFILEALADYLRGNGYRTETAQTCKEACDRIAEFPFDVVLCDINLPDADGFRLLEFAKERTPEAAVILMTGFGTIEHAVEAIRMGAFDYLSKPLIDDELNFCIQRAMGQRQVVRENKSLRAQLDQRFGLGNIIGRDYKMVKMFDLVESVADTRTTVQVLGESGTGKTMTARAIHQLSSRRDKPFVEVACGALPDTLLESELFGHMAGSFTGAIHDKIGKFLQADGGTIFLDEIGDMSLKTQSKVLRVLEEGEVQRVGSNKINKVDVRVIAATNKDLKKEIEKGNFRDDLFFRLNVVPLYSPALREKREDVPLLIEYFSKLYAEENNFKMKSFSPEAIEAMIKYPWKGNVRELRNVVERLLIMTDRDTIEQKDLPEQIIGEHRVYLPEPDKVKTLKDFRDLAEKDFILAKLEQNNWNISQTAREIDTPRSNLYKKLEQYGIKISAGAGEAVAPGSSEEE